MSRIFAVGDIHGCYGKLTTLMNKINIDFDKDLLIFVGDYIDRGPDSCKVVNFLLQLKNYYRNIILLRGNHEEMLMKYLAGVDPGVYMINGGQETLNSYKKQYKDLGPKVIPPNHFSFFINLVMYYETDEYIFVHAGLRENVPLAEQTTADLLWIRKEFIDSNYDFGKRVIFGHTPFAEPLVQANKIGIDTGAVYDNKLTCLELPRMVFHQV
jgi:serine/threonine protein phosphatase 1